MNDKHNYNLSEPLIKKLLETLGSEWKHGSCLNDSCASVYRDFGNDQFMSIYVPNATKTNLEQEQYSDFSLNISDNEYTHYDRIEEVIQRAKDMESEQAKTELTEKQIQRLQNRLYEVQGAIHHWNNQKNQAEYYLKARTKEKKELVERLSKSKAEES